jgi:glycerol-3-phosphate dehydrogenase
MRKREACVGAEAYDIIVIGGGINVCGIARDAAGRGYSVLLAEMNDLASGTSSASTKLVHGGLRYLEQYRFGLVREALMEREVLWAMAPHIIWPLRLVLPHHRGLRPAWLLRLGLFIYDHIGGRKRLPKTEVLDLARDEAGGALKPDFTKAFEFSDCWVNDSRLVVLNARSAADLGASIRTRSRVVSAVRHPDSWSVTIEDVLTGKRESFTARLVVNAAGPWVDMVLAGAMGWNDARNVRLVQGSHIVIRKKFEHDRAYFFQNADGRIFFAIPYEEDFTLIGTTDRDYEGEPGEVEISDAEIDYLCAGASEYFREPVTRADIVWSYSGVRPLYDDGNSKAHEATRDYVLEADSGPGKAPLVNIFGGKITTYRKLAEAAMAQIVKLIGGGRQPWTEGAPLPGGEFPVESFEAQVKALKADYPFLEAGHARRLTRLYGTRARMILGDATTHADLGRHFGADLYEAEVAYLAKHEWALTSEDVLWRRTKRGLTLTAEEAAALDEFMRKTGSGAKTAAA